MLNQNPLLPSCPLSKRPPLLLLEEDRLAEPLAVLLLPVMMSADAFLEGKLTPAAPAAAGPVGRPSLDKPRMGDWGAPPTARGAVAGAAEAVEAEEVAVSGVALAVRLLLPSLLSADAR